jgi:hypothetical protein
MPVVGRNDNITTIPGHLALKDRCSANLTQRNPRSCQQFRPNIGNRMDDYDMISAEVYRAATVRQSKLSADMMGAMPWHLRRTNIQNTGR